MLAALAASAALAGLAGAAGPTDRQYATYTLTSTQPGSWCSAALTYGVSSSCNCSEPTPLRSR